MSTQPWPWGADHDSMTLRVTCPSCGFLGAFFVSPEQSYEGALRRAEDLRERHDCVNDAEITVPTERERENA